MTTPRLTFVALLVVIGAVAALPLRSAEPDGPAATAVETLPASRGGQDVVGTTLPDLAFDRWLPAAPQSEREARPPVTLYRWWTAGCPFCERTLPAVERLRQQHEKRGLRVVAVFHPKPVRAVEAERTAKTAAAMGYSGLVAIDEDWSELKRAYLDRSATGRATSVTLLVDRAGVVRFVHPGTQFFPSSDADAAQEDSDYRLLDKAIAALLAEE
jgi:thiol-disulfide isomerase/thioredoxin